MLTNPGQSWTVHNIGKRIMFGGVYPTYHKIGRIYWRGVNLESDYRDVLPDTAPYGGDRVSSSGSQLSGGYWTDGAKLSIRWYSAGDYLVIGKARKIAIQNCSKTIISWAMISGSILVAVMKSGGTTYVETFNVGPYISSGYFDYSAAKLTSVPLSIQSHIRLRFTQKTRTLFAKKSNGDFYAFTFNSEFSAYTEYLLHTYVYEYIPDNGQGGISTSLDSVIEYTPGSEGAAAYRYQFERDSAHYTEVIGPEEQHVNDILDENTTLGLRTILPTYNTGNEVTGWGFQESTLANFHEAHHTVTIHYYSGGSLIGSDTTYDSTYTGEHKLAIYASDKLDICLYLNWLHDAQQQETGDDYVLVGTGVELVLKIAGNTHVLRSQSFINPIPGIFLLGGPNTIGHTRYQMFAETDELLLLFGLRPYYSPGQTTPTPASYLPFFVVIKKSTLEFRLYDGIGEESYMQNFGLSCAPM